MIKPVVKKYVEMALREKISKTCPHYPKSLTNEVVNVSMENMGVSKDVLYRAIEIAYQDKELIRRDYPAICKDCEQYAGDCEFCGYKE